MQVRGNPRPTCPPSSSVQLSQKNLTEEAKICETFVESPAAAAVSPRVAPTIQTGRRTDLNQEEGLLLVQGVRNLPCNKPALSAGLSSDVSLRFFVMNLFNSDGLFVDKI